MEKRRNGQVVQPNVAYPPEGNGWPLPLTDSGPEIKVQKTEGKSGTTESHPVEKCVTGAYGSSNE